MCWVQVQEYLGAGASLVVVDAAELLHARAAWATHAANQLMADVGAQRLLFDANSDAKVNEAFGWSPTVGWQSHWMVAAAAVTTL
jgi:phosphosulfolactate synthase (CoM biosynthesis protein A)